MAVRTLPIPPPPLFLSRYSEADVSGVGVVGADDAGGVYRGGVLVLDRVDGLAWVIVVGVERGEMRVQQSDAC